jgi:cytochrome c biogenesis protein
MATTTTRPDPATPARPPALSPWELTRWVWRQLTSMRIALVLLFLLAVAAIPGSLVPQTPVDPVAVSEFKARHPALTPWYERISMFNVFASPWFSAIYLLLMISLIGCLVPRTRLYLRTIKARPPAAPRNLERLPEHRRLVLEGPGAEPAAVLRTARGALRGLRFRVDEAADGRSVAAERGYLRDTGNLVFHMSWLLVLIGIAYGHLYGYRGSSLVVEGEGFSNTVTQYDNLRMGPLLGSGALAPFSLHLDTFKAEYQVGGAQNGAARLFEARITSKSEPGAASVPGIIRVNHPFEADGAKVSLGAHGYAPVVTVRDGAGDEVFTGPVPFLPVDPVGFTSRGVIKVPDAKPSQLGFQGFFLPTAAFDMGKGPFSTFPAPNLPRLLLNVWSGDLGLDGGVPQSVYRLDTTRMKQVVQEGGVIFTRGMAVGESMDLPDGQGSLRFDGYRQWVVLQVAYDPGRMIALAGAALALTGLLASLFVRPRRLWVRAERDSDGRTVIDVGALARSDGAELAEDVDRVTAAIGESHGPPRPAAAVQKE